ncbi:PREDICTED: rho GTPase-activating protein SYDE1 [Pseudopodoces humilis]|uniref:rho GTPase-activating protein SYDE1 n=1 Tax=Pseudopodoces humilis TaxID=181119 RepID=UPI0006B7F41D|nr:PREDICTED: rho GTPase-activating protein SYDE1 [Pseudopodoces humilis]
MAEPLLRRTLSRLRRRERRGAGRAEAEEGGGSRRSGCEEPQNHREEPQNDRVEPQSHRVEPLNHRVEPQNLLGEPQNHRVQSQNDRVEPQNHREEPQNRFGEPPNLNEEPQSHREEPRARRPEPDGAEPWEEAEAGGGPPVLGGPGSLERSSRRWVLAGKGAEDAGATGHGDSGAARGDIWYNPIPEDEDDEGTRGEGTPKGLGTTEGHGDRGEEAGAGRGQASGKPPEPPSPPGKGRPLPKCKSPGPVRRLSLKMKKLPELRRKLSLRSPRPRDPDGAGGCPSPPESRRESRNVISRYHLDSSVAWALPRGGSGRAGHRSDGDSPELPARPARPGGPAEPGLDLGAFRPYEDPAARGSAVLSGLVSVQLRGLRPAWPERLFCVLQVDGASRARTALLAGGAEFLRLDHCFNLELERARLLSVAVLAWDGSAGRNRLLCHGTVGLARLFEGGRSQALALALRPRAVLFCRLSLSPSLSPSPSQPRVAPGPRVFGVELSQLVAREGHPGQVPLLVLKCLAEIERRGLAVVGLYRLCGSAAAKKELRDAFERDSAAVALSERLCPDINVVTGILKDFLRELPSPLVPPRLQRSVLEAMAQRPPRDPPGDPAALLECLRPPERATLRRLLSHLSLVAALQRWNRMGSQNLAVCFGPVLLPPHTCAGEAARPRGQQGQQGHAPGQQGQQGQEPGEDAAGAVDFKRHLEVLHYLLRVWPVPPLPAWAEAPRGRPSALALSDPPVVALSDPPVVAPGDPPVVARSRPRGPESPPSNRYAGDWSVCDPRGAPGDSDGDTDFDALIRELERELGTRPDVGL